MKIRTYFNTIIFSIFFLHIILVTAAGAANKIMPLGDSITWDDRIEAGGDNRDDGDRIAYRYRLWQLLTYAGYDFDFVGSQYTGFDIFPDAENEGHPGWTDNDIAASVYDFLLDNPADIILLHIGTNMLDPDPTGVKNILDEIDRYESDFATKITVILARIVNRVPYDATTTLYNDNVEDMVFLRVNDPTDPAFPDNIIFGPDVDMEDGAGIEYRLLTDTPPGDMWDYLHPADSGYSKMADVWFFALEEILPQADAGPDQNVYEFDTVTLDASGSSDPKGGTLTYQWVQTAGTPVVVLSPDAQAKQPTFDAPNAGLTGKTLTFTLTVTDEDELVSTDTVDITVAKIAPLADAGPDQTVNNSAAVTLDASGSVGVGLGYQWTQTAGTTVNLSGAQTVQATFNASDVGPSGGTLNFELTVTDDDGVESTDTVDITVTMLPQADAGPDQSVDEFDTVTLDGSGSIPAGALSYEWTQTAGTTVGQFDDQAIQPSFIAPDVAPGSETLTFSLTVTDEDNLQSTDTVSITVHNPTSSDGGGGGGGGGGCFIGISADGPHMALNSNVLLELCSQFAMVVLIGLCVANTLRKPRKRWINLYHQDRLKLLFFPKRRYLHIYNRLHATLFNRIIVS